MKGSENLANTVSYRGNFQLGDMYHTMDVVTFGGKEYFCIQANDFKEPGRTDYWALIGRGKSAYELALDNGYVGSEKKFVQDMVGGKPDFELKDGHIYANGTDLGAFSSTVPTVKSQAVTVGQNLDTITKEGNYYDNGVGILNLPSDAGTNWVLEVIGQGTAIIQRLTSIASGDEYLRTYNGSTWSQWIKSTHWQAVGQTSQTGDQS